MNAFFILLACGALAVFAYFSPWVWRQFRMRKVSRQLFRERVAVLTYDDGPSESLTPRLLDLLNQHDVKATFFMLGRNAAKYPHVVDRVLKEGHDIGCHSDQHLHAWKAAPQDAIKDINAGYDRLSKWMPKNGMFRPPYGKMTLPTWLSVRRRGSPVWWWTLDSGDTSENLPPKSELRDAFVREKGGIVLLHDMEREADREEFVYQTTATLLEAARKESIRVVPLRDLYS